MNFYQNKKHEHENKTKNYYHAYSLFPDRASLLSTNILFKGVLSYRDLPQKHQTLLDQKNIFFFPYLLYKKLASEPPPQQKDTNFTWQSSLKGRRLSQTVLPTNYYLQFGNREDKIWLPSTPDFCRRPITGAFIYLQIPVAATKDDVIEGQVRVLQGS